MTTFRTSKRAAETQCNHNLLIVLFVDKAEWQDRKIVAVVGCGRPSMNCFLEQQKDLQRPPTLISMWVDTTWSQLARQRRPNLSFGLNVNQLLAAIQLRFYEEAKFLPLGHTIWFALPNCFIRFGHLLGNSLCFCLVFFEWNSFSVLPEFVFYRKLLPVLHVRFWTNSVSYFSNHLLFEIRRMRQMKTSSNSFWSFPLFSYLLKKTVEMTRRSRKRGRCSSKNCI